MAQPILAVSCVQELQVDIQFPLFVFAKDDRSMRYIEDPSRILYHLEAIDFENDEYVFWDVRGKGVQMTVAKNKVVSLSSCLSAFPVRDAFLSYAASLRLPEPVLEGTPAEIWDRIQTELESRPRKRNFLSRLFSK